MRILLVEDDEALANVLTTLLSKNNYLVDIAADGEIAWEMVNVISYDLLLLDVNLPKLDGINLCRRLRDHHFQTPVMLMTVRDSVTDKLIGLESGADDYLVKPFNLQELLARIRVFSRRPLESAPTLLSCGKIGLNAQMREITYDGQVIAFSRKEYLLLELFLRHPHRVFSRSDIVDHLWSLDNLPTEDTVKSHIRRIRRKLNTVGAEDLIETLYGHGYRINPAIFHQISDDLNTAQVKELDEAVEHIWQNIRSRVLNQVAMLQQTALKLQAGQIDADQIALAERNAHQLAGTVGTCGFEVASHIARAIEALLQSPIPPEKICSFNGLIEILRWELEQPSQPVEAGEPAKPEMTSLVQCSGYSVHK